MAASRLTLPLGVPKCTLTAYERGSKVPIVKVPPSNNGSPAAHRLAASLGHGFEAGFEYTVRQRKAVAKNSGVAAHSDAPGIRRDAFGVEPSFVSTQHPGLHLIFE